MVKEMLSGLTEFSIFNVLEHPDSTGYQYFTHYAKGIVEELNKGPSFPAKSTKFNIKFENLFRFDGEAYHESGVDYVNINDGVVLTTFEVFYDILSHFPVLPYLSPEPGSLGIRLVYNYDSEQYQTTMNFPIDFDRRIIAEYMAMFAIKFMILHEIGHHYNGHIRYWLFMKKEKNKLQPTPDDVASSPISMLDWQTMEMDADAFAVSRLIEEIVDLLRSDVRLCSRLKHSDDIFVMFIIAIQTLFLIFKKEATEQWDDESSPYFSTFIRGSLNLGCAKTNIAYKAKGIITEERFSELLRSSIPEAETYFHSLYRISHYQDAVDYKDTSAIHIRNVHKNWANVREKLLPFARVRLAD